MTETMNIVKGKYGFYPTDYETYLKLKKLNQFRLMDRRMEKAWERWNRKEPQNRVQRRTLVNDLGQKIGYEKVLDANGQPVMRPESERCPVSISHFVEEDYRNARYPKATEAEVVPLSLTLSSIDQQLAACEEWATRKK